MHMKISWMRAKDDDKSFRFLKNIGFDVYEIEDLDKTDELMEKLVRKTL